MNTAALREQISRAHQHEASTGQLAQQLEKQLPHLLLLLHPLTKMMKRKTMMKREKRKERRKR